MLPSHGPCFLPGGGVVEIANELRGFADLSELGQGVVDDPETWDFQHSCGPSKLSSVVCFNLLEAADAG